MLIFHLYNFICYNHDFGFTVLLVEVKEMEYREEREKKELEILELTRQLKIQNEEKQNEIIKLQIEVCITKMT